MVGRVEDYAIVGDMHAAAGQLQLDVYGEVIDALQLSCKSGLHDDRHTWSLQRSLLGFLERHWTEPDEGLWEVRGPRRYRRLVGNMPQAFSHVPLVQTALNLGGHAEEHRRGPQVPWDERRSVPG